LKTEVNESERSAAPTLTQADPKRNDGGRNRGLKILTEDEKREARKAATEARLAYAITM